MISHSLRFTFIPVALTLLSACTTPQAQWDATHLRVHAMDYYNAQIMDNLIRAQHGLAFVHVDIAGLNSAVNTTIAASFGGGESTTNTGTRGTTNQATTTESPGGAVTAVATTLGAAASLAHAVTRSFTYSFSPTRSDLINYNTTPLMGDTVVYDAYAKFTKKYHLPGLSNPPAANSYVPGTLRKWDDNLYYYVPNTDTEKEAYRKLCMEIFIRGGPKKETIEGRQELLEQQLKRNKNDLDQLRSQELIR
jgi:hypothetical protein